MRVLTTGVPVASTLFFGAIFGFFYAWICSTMWAFDLLDPRIAMEVMQVVNENVRNGVFFLGFMMTPVVAFAAAGLLFFTGKRAAAWWFSMAAVIYLCGGLLLTIFANVPMNEQLAMMPIPESEADAATIWAAYSPLWQMWNITRTVLSGVALAMAAMGLIAMKPSGAQV